MRIDTLNAAQQYAAAGRLEQWIHEFLLSEGNNASLAGWLKTEQRYYGVLACVSLSNVHRVCGPEDDMEYKESSEVWEEKVAALMVALRDNWDAPPLIALYHEGGLFLRDGNHRFEAMRRLGIQQYWIIVEYTKEDYVSLVNH